MEEAVMEILKNLEIKGAETPHFPKNGYSPIILSKENFHKIDVKKSEKKVAFIDGGNQEIIGSSNFSLQFMRVYYCIYQNNKRISKETFETFVLVTIKKINGNLNYCTNFFSDKINPQNFNIYDKTMSIGSHKASVGSAADAARKNLEMKTAKELCEKVDIILLDGNLEATVTGEKELLDALYKRAEETDTIIAGFSKTSSLLTESGNNVSAILNNISDRGVWNYHPLVKINNPNHLAELHIVKLHEKAKHIFRLDVHESDDIDELLTVLINNSKDPVFLGYPYGLVEADRYARVSNKEVDMIKTKLFVKLGKNLKRIQSYLNTNNAHDILDSIG